MEISNKNIFPQNKTKLLLLKKIKIKKFPEFKKNLNDYFWKIDKYFQPRYNDYKIQIGHSYNKKINIPYTNKRKGERRKTRLLTKSFTLNDKKDSRITLNNTSSHFEKRRCITKNIKESGFKGLKVGQKYISDFELEDLFNNFKEKQKLNKEKINNYMTIKEYIDNNSLIIANKTSTNFNNFIKEFKSKKSLNTNEHKILPDLGEGGGNHFLSPKKYQSNIINLNNDYYKTSSTFMSINNIKETKDDNNNFCLTCRKSRLNSPINEYNDNAVDKKSKTAKNFYNHRELDEKTIISRNNLIKRQNQFLFNSKEEEKFSQNKTERIIFAKLLANQEQVLKNKSKNMLKNNNIYNIISKKVHKPKERLLMTNIDSFRIKNELKEKFCALNSKIEPEHYYNWIKDLREESSINNNICNINSYNIRDPYNKTIYINTSKKNFAKKANIKFYKKLIEETNNINNNMEGLYIDGRNLLKTEYEQIKSYRSKKIINNYEAFLPTSNYEDILFTDQKYINKKNIKLKNSKKFLK